MNNVSKAILAALCPPIAPRGEFDEFTKTWWKITCILNIFLLTAIWHNRVFYYGSCMLIGIAWEYNIPGIKAWLSQDPSPPLAAISAFFLFMAGKEARWLRTAVAPLFVSTIPLALWIWDIPFTRRIICRTLHDKHSIALLGIELNTIHAFLLSARLYAMFFLISLKRKNIHAG